MIPVKDDIYYEDFDEKNMSIWSLRPDESVGVKRNECIAYIAYLVEFYDQLPDYTIFLQGDAAEHSQYGGHYLRLVWRALEQGALTTGFIHLGLSKNS